MRYVELTTVNDSFQAYFLKKALEDEGIQCIVANEHSSYMLPIPGPLGLVIQVRVTEEDFDAAQKVLAKLRVDTDEVICPNCGSKDVTLGLGSTNKFKRIVMLMMSFAFFATPGKVTRVYTCNVCNTEFDKNKY
ncbi:MAG: DUF2007 domain-containing protein [Bacteroidota bacterium]